MKALSLRHPAIRSAAFVIAIGMSAVLPSGCLAPGGYDDGGTVGVDYYEPYGADYGGWGSGYRVGPYHGGGGDRGGDHGSSHAYRSAPAGRSMPSIPSRSRGGGGHGR